MFKRQALDKLEFDSSSNPQSNGKKVYYSNYNKSRLGIGGWVVLAICAVILSVVLRAFVIRSYKIPSSSMSPTLAVGDHVLVNLFVYGFYLFDTDKRALFLRSPERGDVVVFKRILKAEDGADDESPRRFIKRIIGLPGETVEVRSSGVYVNGKRLVEGANWPPIGSAGLYDKSFRYVRPIALGGDEYFVLGDNRANSKDSRYFGPIKTNEIEGLAFMIYWSWPSNKWPFDVRWDRVAKRIN